MRQANAGAISEAATVPEVQSTHNLDDARKTVLLPAIHGSLRLSDTVTSTCYFIHQLVIPVGWFALIPKLYQDSEEGGCFKSAVEAASTFLYANRTGKDHFFARARSMYSSALTATNIAISDPFESLRDETFCAILVLNIIDVSTVGDATLSRYVDHAAGHHWGHELCIRYSCRWVQRVVVTT